MIKLKEIILISCLTISYFGKAVKEPKKARTVVPKVQDPNLGFLDFPAEKKPSFELNYEFILPNEHCPELAEPIWKSSSSGLYISVGTERSFIGAALSNANKLLILDMHPYITAYNRMIVQMLKIAENGRDFFLMRTNLKYFLRKIIVAQTDPKDSHLKLDSPFIAHMLGKTKWTQIIKNSKSRLVPHATHWMWRTSINRPKVRYWENENLYQKLRAMALSNNIQSRTINLSDNSSMEKIRLSLETRGIKVSVMDFSNTHFQSFLGFEGIKAAINSIRTAFNPHSLVFLSWAWQNPEKLGEYAGFYYKDFQQVPSLALADSLKHTVIDKALVKQAKLSGQKAGSKSWQEIYSELKKSYKKKVDSTIQLCRSLRGHTKPREPIKKTAESRD